MRRALTLVCLAVWINIVSAQDSLQVLFLGNSLTYYYDLPQHLQQLAQADGKYLYFEMYAPGGYTLGWHLDDAETMNRINSRQWDYVILQEQGNIPLIPWWYENDMKPNVEEFNWLLNQRCITPVFYLPAGVAPVRYPCKSCDPIPQHCSKVFNNYNEWTDAGADAYSRLSELYSIPLVPAGLAWKTPVAQNVPLMFDGDGLHPGPKGQYLNACVFYSALFNTAAVNNSYHSIYSAQEALFFQHIADSFMQVYKDSFNLPLLKPSMPDFYVEQNSLDVEFTANYTGRRAAIFTWLFGDGETSLLRNPEHHYTAAGNYEVKLIIDDGCKKDTVSREISVTDDQTALYEIDESAPLKVYPNPAGGTLYLSNVKKNSMIRLYDLKGQLLLEKYATTENEMRLEISNLVPGLYVVSVIDEGGVKYIQITKSE